MKNRAVFLDRDGVINRAFVRAGKPFPPRTLEEFEILPGVGEAVGLLRKAGYRLVVVTNQPDVATGAQRLELVEAIHRRIWKELGIDAIKACYHTDRDCCACRKPQPGMLLEAAAEFGLILTESFMIGDRWKDITAGKAVGCKTLFVDYEYDEPQPDAPDAIVHSLLEASLLIVNGQFSSPKSGEDNAKHQ